MPELLEPLRPPNLAAALSLLAGGDAGLSVLELQALRTADPGALPNPDAHYWLGIAYVQAFVWSEAIAELRAYLSADTTTWRAGWASLHLGRAYQQAGRDDEAALAYRGCLAIPGVERAARRFAFDLMSRIADSLPMGYGQAPTRPAQGR